MIVLKSDVLILKPVKGKDQLQEGVTDFFIFRAAPHPDV